MGSKNLFSIRNFSFSYKNKEVLQIDNLRIPKGKVVVIKGSNGSGKTTLLKVLNKLLPQSNGEIQYLDKSINEEVIRKHSVYLQQDPYLFRGTVEKNLSMVLRIKKIDHKKWKKIIDDKLQMVGLTSFQMKKCNELSGGEKKRVSLARALLTEPQVLFLDEPDANIDNKSLKLLEDLLGILREAGVSIIMSTHSKRFGYRCGDKHIHLKTGKIKMIEENLYKGDYNHIDGHYGTFSTGRSLFAVPGMDGDYKTALLSPNDVILSKDKIETSAQNQFKGTVSKIVKQKGYYSITIDIPEKVISHITEESFKKLEIETGTSLFVIFKASAIKLY